MLLTGGCLNKKKHRPDLILLIRFSFPDNLIGGLQSVANFLNVERFGTQHQVRPWFRL